MTDFTPLIILSEKRASDLSEFLKQHNIRTTLSPAAKSEGMFSISVDTVRLETAVKLLESVMMLGGGSAGTSADYILIPVDFSPKSRMGCKVGFELAERLNASAHILHTYVVPILTPGQDRDLTSIIAGDEQFREAEARELDRFKAKVERWQQEGVVNKVKTKYVLIRGLAEDVIKDYSRDNVPKMIVMTTRSRSRKNEDMVGSVTAEVLDSCRVPLFTVPEDYDFQGIRKIKRLIFCCNLDEKDTASMERFLRLFEYPEASVTLIPVINKFGTSTKSRLDALCSKLSDRYPSVTFDTYMIQEQRFERQFKEYVERESIEIVIVQNRKKNIFSRLLNPGFAHLLFYERDMPMIVLPV